MKIKILRRRRRMTSTQSTKNMSSNKFSSFTSSTDIDSSNTEYPTLSQANKIKPGTKIKSFWRENKASATKMTLGTSHRQSRQNQYRSRQDYRQRDYQPRGNYHQHREQQRDNTCTKACRAVAGKETGAFGVCTRKTCGFSHSKEEHRWIQCNFGDRCRFIDQRKPDGSVCRFGHPGETFDGYYERIGRPSPNLPETNKLSRRPQTDSRPVASLPPSARDVPKMPEHEEQDEEQDEEIPVQPELSKFRWGAADALAAESDSDSDSDSDNDVDMIGLTEPEFTTKLVRVPTEELAKIALENLFSRGIFDVKVVIE